MSTCKGPVTTRNVSMCKLRTRLSEEKFKSVQLLLLLFRDFNFATRKLL